MFEIRTMAETFLSKKNGSEKGSQNNQSYGWDKHVACIWEQSNDDRILHWNSLQLHDVLLADETDGEYVSQF